MKEYTCPNAERKGQEIRCRKAGDYCGNVRFCQMAGRWVLTEFAMECPLRKETKDGQK